MVPDEQTGPQSVLAPLEFVNVVKTCNHLHKVPAQPMKEREERAAFVKSRQKQKVKILAVHDTPRSINEIANEQRLLLL
jgi:hypothetical protein